MKKIIYHFCFALSALSCSFGLFTSCLFNPYGSNSTSAKCKQVKGSVVVGSKDYKMWDNDLYEGCFKENTTFVINDLLMAKYETTREDFRIIMSDPTLNTIGVSALPSDTLYYTKYKNTREAKGLVALDSVTWYDAVYYCNLLSIKEGFTPVYTMTNIKTQKDKISDVEITHIVKATVTQDLSKNGWRLPTEVEWEYAARGGDPSKEDWFYEYSGAKSVWNTVPKSESKYDDGSDKALDKVAWYNKNITNNGVTEKARAQEGDEGFGPHQVGLKSPNRLGLYDMSGNVSEWCTDEFINTYALDGKEYKYHRIKGGCWSYLAEYQCVAGRASLEESLYYQRNGFRVCRNY